MLDHFRNAMSSIWNNKVSSLLTILGVVIGVASVTILIALGEGLKKDVSSVVQGLGTNVIAVVAGKIDTTGKSSGEAPNPAAFISGDILTIEDVKTISDNNKIKYVSPMSMVSSSIKKEDKIATPTVIGTYPEMFKILELLKVGKGKPFTSSDQGDVIVLNNDSSIKLFGANTNPVGKKVTIADREFTVIGVFQKPSTTNSLSGEYESISMIPFDTATYINKDQVKIMRIVAQVKTAEDVKIAKSQLQKAIKKNHGEEDFTLMTQDDMLNMFNSILGLVTTLVSAIAAISLVVGGIGIMNIMLVTVTERTKEIGLRKAVGATNTAILNQFLIEAFMITILGGLIGLAIAVFASVIISARTELTPSITPKIVLIAVGISSLIGIIFGLWPALRAAKKDPIEALRHE